MKCCWGGGGGGRRGDEERERRGWGGGGRLYTLMAKRGVSDSIKPCPCKTVESAILLTITVSLQYWRFCPCNMTRIADFVEEKKRKCLKRCL